jgi:hypothetical protein
VFFIVYKRFEALINYIVNKDGFEPVSRAITIGPFSPMLKNAAILKPIRGH